MRQTPLTFAARTFRGDESRRRRGWDADSPWRRVAAPPRLERAVETSNRTLEPGRRYVCEFLEGEDLLVYGRSSPSTRTWLSDGVGEQIWRAGLKRDGLERCWWLGEDETPRSRVLRHAAVTRLSRRFVDEFCNEAATRRKTDVAPRTYGRKRDGVSHPLPGSGSRKGDVLARVHTLGADGRRRALQALEACCLCTCAHWTRGPELLVKRGAVALFVALLSNELGAIQDLAAAALANLICCENARSDVLDEFRACDARRPLTALLSSPSARVTLHVPFTRNHVAHLLPAADVTPRSRIAAAALAAARRENYCQGVGCKAAARALANAYPRPAPKSSPVSERSHFGRRRLDGISAS